MVAGVPVALAAAFSVLLRLRMYWSPISSDEAGFLVIARSWAHGRHLYRDTWVDRPQGILVLYRFWDWLSGGSVASVRIMAMIFGVVLVIAVAHVATQLAGPSAGVIAALLVAATSANPAIEGHIANGELLGGSVAIAGLAIGVRAIVTGRTRLLFVAGIIAGLALSLKQSAFEGFGTLLVWLAISPRLGWRTRRAAVRDTAALVGGTAIVVAAMAIHGATLGWSRWWYAAVAHRFEERSAVSGPTWGRLWSTFLVAGPILLPLVLACVTALMIRRSSHMSPVRTSIRLPHVLGIWSGVVAISFLLGGNYFRHYWLLWCPVLAVAGGVALARVMTRRVAVAAGLTLLAPGLLAAASILEMDRAESGATASDDPRLGVDEPVAKWFAATARPGEHIFAMCASPGLYADIGIDPETPYLWRDHVRMHPDAVEQIATLLMAPDAPDYVAMYQPPSTCDSTGRLETALRTNYTADTEVAGIEILRRRDAANG